MKEFLNGFQGSTRRSAWLPTASALALALMLQTIATRGEAACTALDLEVRKVEPPPMQVRAFCEKNPEHCRLSGPAILEWTEDLATTLESINRAVNAEIAFQPDWDARGVEELWCFPVGGTGDCEDYALEKRRRLVALGLPGASLTLAIVHHTERLFAHALLLVETTAGTFVLDNLDDGLRCWNAVPYRYERREGLDGRWLRYHSVIHPE